jgi:hypothetical protein
MERPLSALLKKGWVHFPQEVLKVSCKKAHSAGIWMNVIAMEIANIRVVYINPFITLTHISQSVVCSYQFIVEFRPTWSVNY